MRTIVLAILCLGIALGLSFLLRDSSRGISGLEGGRELPGALVQAPGDLPPAPENNENTTTWRDEVDSGPSSEPTPPAREALSRAAPRASAEPEGALGFRFEGRLITPTGNLLRVKHVRAEFRSTSGRVLAYEGDDSRAIHFNNVQQEHYDLTIETEGYVYHPRRFDFTPVEPLGDATKDLATERVTLWPSGWIPVVVLTPDGRPIRTLAEDRGWKPKNLFSGVFDVRLSRELAVSGDALPPLDPHLGSFHRATGYRAFELPGNVIGSLQLHEDPPLWASLWVNDRVRVGRILRAEDTHLVFSLNQQDMDDGLASLSLRLVDEGSSAPVIDATATLKADNSAHRRSDLYRHVPDDYGKLLFKHVMPGQHELAIERGGRIVQRRIQLAPGQALDLGDVAIGNGPGLPVRVMNHKLKGVQATIEIAPYIEGEWVKDLYPPNLHRSTSDQGLATIPVPDRKWILRVRVRPDHLPQTDFHSYARFSYPEIASRNYLIEPNALPAELVIVADPEVAMELAPQAPLEDDQLITYEDEFRLVVARSVVTKGKAKRVLLVPGAYTARRWSADPRTSTKPVKELGALPVSVAVGQKLISCP